jgi:hydroxymethylbilane synthase
MREIIIGSRGSDLALWQANFVQSQLNNLGYGSQIKIIVTKGDRIQHLSFDKIEGKGFFTKEIEDALLAGEIDLAVHSLKDLPTTSPAGLVIGATSYREDARDLLLIRPEAHDAAAPLGLKAGSVVGTSSARRKVQVKLLQDNVSLKDLRGNVPTRIQKCRDGLYDAILLAAAGVSRLKLPLDDFKAIYLAADKFVPAPAQGVLGLQIREHDNWMQTVTAQLHHADVAQSVATERKTLHLFEGGCHMPVGAYCIPKENAYELTIVKSGDENQLPIKIRLTGTSPEMLAKEAVSKANKARSGRIFISRERAECGLLVAQLEDHGYEAVCESLIETAPKSFGKVPATDWLFFVSRNAANYFLERQQPAANVRIAAVGEGTAQAIAAHGYETAFVGEGRDLSIISQSFIKVAQGSKVLFPVGNRSKRSIQQGIQDACQVEELIVYTNKSKPISLAGDLLAVVLTSPSAAESYLQANQVQPNTLFVAMGSSTAESLRQAGVKQVVQSFGFRQDELAMTLFSHL